MLACEFMLSYSHIRFWCVHLCEVTKAPTEAQEWAVSKKSENCFNSNNNNNLLSKVENCGLKICSKCVVA
jgi:G:T-mismatch repair DNA endonuclease (very short patch repair protein)